VRFNSNLLKLINEKKIKEVIIVYLWIIFLPLAYSLKILSFIFSKFKNVFALINSKASKF